MLTLISFIVVINLIVFVHEFGHYIAARLSGVMVEIFSIGMPPKMFGKKIGDTLYQIAWVPLGGFVKLRGMIDESMDEDIDPNDPEGFMAQPLLNKVFILSAGVIMNMLLAFVIYSALTWNSGVTELAGTEITMVAEDFPAADAGIVVGDIIISIAGQDVKEWEELTTLVRDHPDEPIAVNWMRDDSLYTATLVPKATEEFNLKTFETETVGKIGVIGSFTTQAVGPLTAMKYGALQVGWVIELSGKSLLALVTGKANIKDVAGPIGIAKMSGESAKSGVANFLGFIALISVSIGFLNILPIPMLDGGHIVFVVIEGVIRREIPETVKLNIMKVGFALLILLLVVVSYHDILRFFAG
ncbi:RIP metalloprotease RseP [Calditrichota bacterium]